LLRQLVSDIGNEARPFGELAKIPNDRVRNFRNDLYPVSEALRPMQKTHPPAISADWQVLGNYKTARRQRHEIHPRMGQMPVTMALGLGTMVG
jgi:inorganic phosphate transporter, PiT family